VCERSICSLSAKLVDLSEAAKRFAAETIAPAPPGVPRLVPGQRISTAYVAWLTANCDQGAFFQDPLDPSDKKVRVVSAS
jgi:arginine/lysine/ornithine decarboxylase